MYRLFFLAGQFKGKRLTVQQGSVLIGRDADCHLQIPDEGISGKQAIIEERSDGLYIKALSEATPTAVNGKPATEQKLNPGDRIVFGPVELQFEKKTHEPLVQSRPIDHVQALTLGAVILIILIEIGFLVSLSIWRKDNLNIIAPVVVAAKPEKVEEKKDEKEPIVLQIEEMTEEDRTLQQAEERLQELERTRTNEVYVSASSVATGTAMVSEELKQLKEDVADLRQQVQDITVSQAMPQATVELPKPATQAVAVAKAVAKATTKKPPAAVLKTAPATKGPGQRLVITSMDHQKFQQNNEFEEMRLIRIGLKPREGERKLKANQVRVLVSFFDRDSVTGEIKKSRVATPKDALRLDSELSGEEPRVVTAAYVVPRGFRDLEAREYSEKRLYYGYRVQVFYGDQLQDEDAKPKTLLYEDLSLF